MDFQCPTCSEPINPMGARPGKSIQCKSCGHFTKVPQPTAEKLQADSAGIRGQPLTPQVAAPSLQPQATGVVITDVKMSIPS